MIAQVTGLEVGEFIHTIGDAHIYLNQLDGINTQLSRKPLPLAKIWLNSKIKHIDDFTMNDIKLINYKHHSTIKMPFAV